MGLAEVTGQVMTRQLTRSRELTKDRSTHLFLTVYVLMQGLTAATLQMLQGWQAALDLPLPGQNYSVVHEDV